ncbi:glutathione S-transferase family protein [Caulobacter sp. BK020]|uniref:glutathione S-transferase family protein n=1 Tax=Caulobacter sp. BK020 TaxID=2512117 RepID=UPI00104F8637|nr:glutathione S-transferase family protein [Caulobacter sp. BK020]TCS16008.1 glutathione S-transferase [Caulobacter sp. BK020]
MLKILGRTSSLNVRKVLWTCDELGLAYEREDWGMGFASTKSPEFLALNPNGLVPVLIDEQGALYESNTICRYLAARYGHGHLLPVEPRLRAVVEQWMDWQATGLNPTWGYAFLALGRPTPGYDDPDKIAASVEAWNRAMAILDHRLAETGAHAAGHDFTLADIVLGVSVHRWMATPMARANLPAVAAYYARLKARPEFGRWALDEVP